MIRETRQTPRIPELDGLRGVAISLVVVFHSFYYSPPAGHHTTGLIRTTFVFLERFFAIGWTGVDLFFVLSGFLIGGILLDVRGSPNYFKTFYLRRFYRIIPIYYLWIALYVLLAAILGQFLSGARTAAVLLLFLQNFGIGYSSQLAGAWFLPTWSLAVEEQFYLIAPVLIRVVSRRKLYALLGAVILAAPLLRIWVHYHIPQDTAFLSLAYTLMPCRADSLAAGILAALLWRSSIFRGWLDGHGYFLGALTGISLLGMAALVAWSPSSDSLSMQSVGYTWIAVFYGLVIVSALSQPSWPIAVVARIHWLGEIGRVSYCLYLIHDAVRVGGAFLLKSLLPNAPSWEFVAVNAVAAVISYLIARLSWVYFENPLLRRGHEFRY
jgi:peptidoglycan/LPS O-acetylase OafA/YrhL